MNSRRKCARAALERLERGGNILGSPDFKSGDFKAEGEGRGLNLAHFQHGVSKSDIGHDRQTAETGDHSRKSSSRLPAVSGC